MLSIITKFDFYYSQQDTHIKSHNLTKAFNPTLLSCIKPAIIILWKIRTESYETLRYSRLVYRTIANHAFLTATRSLGTPPAGVVTDFQFELL